MSIRLRLTLWYTAILFVALSGFAVVIYVGLERLWQSNLDTTVQSRAQDARGQLNALAVASNPNRGTGPQVIIYIPDREQLDSFTRDGVYVQYVDLSGEDQQHSSNLAAPFTLSQADIQAIQNGQEQYETIRGANDEQLRAYILPLRFVNGQLYGAVIAAKPVAPLHIALRRMQLVLAGGVLAATLLLALIVYVVAKTSLRPISRMARDAAGIQQAHDLSRRVAVPNTRDEVAELGTTFNGMLGRLEAAFEAQRRFIADASHELRTPLTAIRGNTDILRQHGDRMDPNDRSEVLDEVAMEAERMSRLVNDLLSLARAQAGEQTRPQPVRFNEAIDGAVRAARGLTRGHELIYTPANEHLWVLGDPDRLKQLALILLDNAIKYTPPEGHIWVAVRRDGNSAELRVMDDGPGIPAERLPHLFDRFYRGGTLARGRDDGGAGLGLAIAREIAQGDGGTIAVESAVGGGSAFIVTLPLLTATPFPNPADLPAQLAPTPVPVAPVKPFETG